MFLTARRLAISLGLAGLLASPAAFAGLGDDAVAGGGEIIVTFEGASALYDSLILVNSGVPFFPDHATARGTTFSIGTFAAGTVLDFALLVTTTGNVFHTGSAAGNPDGLAHAIVIYDYLSPGTTLVRFEDILGGGDKDYNDFVFSFRSVVSAAPEPETSLLMLAGLMAVAWLARRRKSTRF